MPVKQELDGPAGGVCQHGCMDLTGNILLAAKSAAHQLPDNTDAFFGPAQDTRHLGAVLVRNLRSHVDLHAPIRRRNCDAALRLQECMLHHRSVEGVLKDHVRLRKTPLHIPLANLDVLEQISVRVQLRYVRASSLHRIRDDRLRIELGLEFGATARSAASWRLGSHECERIADVANTLADSHEHRPVIDDEAVIALCRDILGRKYGYHARQRIRPPRCPDALGEHGEPRRASRPR